MTSSSPVLIVGGGLAGLFTALKLAPLACTVLSPRPLGEGASSAWAQGGLAAAVDEGDTPEAHAADTIRAGAGLVDPDIALSVAQEARARVLDLLEYGVPFDRTLEGALVPSREAAHSARRIVRVDGDRAGKAIMEALIAAVRATPSITVLEGYYAEDLILDQGQVRGVWARGERGCADQPLPFLASATVLATGGIGHLYAVTTNPPDAQGLGLAIAARAGAVIANAEFVQFHPTALDIDRDPAPLITEALRGEGAYLVNEQGERFMQALHEEADLAPRDHVARGVFAQSGRGGRAYLDAREALGDTFKDRFPTVHAACIAAGIDPSRELIPVAAAAHYHMGGVRTDPQGRTSLDCLWAAGEVASTGLHGANRLASNSLLEAVVFAARIAQDIADTVPSLPTALPLQDLHPFQRTAKPNPQNNEAVLARIRQIMQNKVGVIRSGKGLADACVELLQLRANSGNAHMLNVCTTALLVATAAWMRRESRGAHVRLDYPHTSSDQATQTQMQLSDAEAIAFDLEAQSLHERSMSKVS